MKTIVTWVWKGERAYTLEHAASLAAGLRRFMTTPHRLVVIADRPGRCEGAEVMRIPAAALALAKIKTPERANFPSSYRRLWLFSEAARAIADTILMVDVDVAVTGDWSHLFEYEPSENFMGWLPGQLWGNQEQRVGGGVWRLNTGTRTHVWDRFVEDPISAVRRARSAGYRGSDQAWISYQLARSCPVWPNEVGIRSVRDFNRDDRRAIVGSIPEGTTMVHFNGVAKPWSLSTWKRHPWLKAYWEGEVEEP